jgi:hypothetical protein
LSTHVPAGLPGSLVSQVQVCPEPSKTIKVMDWPSLVHHKRLGMAVANPQKGHLTCCSRSGLQKQGNSLGMPQHV